MVSPKIGEGEDARPIHQLGTTAPATLPTAPMSVPLETERRIQEGLKPKVIAWDRATVPAYKETGSSIKEGRMIKLTKEDNQQQVRLSGQLVIHIPFGSNPEGSTYIGTSANLTIYEASIMVQAT